MKIHQNIILNDDIKLTHTVQNTGAARGNFAMQIRLATTSIYGDSGQLNGQLTASKYEKVGSSVGSGVGCPREFRHAN